MDIKELRQHAPLQSHSTKPASRRDKAGSSNARIAVRRMQVAPAPALSVLNVSQSGAAHAIGNSVWRLASAPHFAAQRRESSAATTRTLALPDLPERAFALMAGYASNQDLASLSRVCKRLASMLNAPLSCERAVHYSAPPRLRSRLEAGLPQFNVAARKLAILSPAQEARLTQALELSRALKACRPQVLSESMRREAEARSSGRAMSTTLNVEALSHGIGSIPIAVRMGTSLLTTASLLGFTCAMAGALRSKFPEPKTAAQERLHAQLFALGILGALLKVISNIGVALDDKGPAFLIPVFWMVGTLTAATVHGLGARDLHSAREGKIALQSIDRRIAEADAVIDEMTFISRRLKFKVSDIRYNSLTFAVDDVASDGTTESQGRSK